MAIRFTDKPEPAKSSKPPKTEAPAPAADNGAQAAGLARFATPIEADAPVNPQASGELPFSDLPRAEKASRAKRPRGKGRDS